MITFGSPSPCRAPSLLRRTFKRFCLIFSWFISLGLSGADAGTKVLIIGGSQPYDSSEAAFNPSAVATNLEGILTGDIGLAKPIVVQNQDTHHSSNSGDSNSLMGWFYWPDNHAAALSLLQSGWDSVVMIEDPYVAAKFPEYFQEGVRSITDQVRRLGTEPVIVMPWSSGSVPINTFGEMAYRVGDGAGVMVAPAGYAWNSLAGALKDTGVRPSPRGAYLTAATVYSSLYHRSAKTSSYVPAGLSLADRDAIADVAFSTVQTETAKSHYSKQYVGPTHFVRPAVTKRFLEIADWNSSTETGIYEGMSQAFARTNMLRYRYTSSYQSFPSPSSIGHTIDFCQSRFASAADLSRWTNSASYDYQVDNGETAMMASVDSVMNYTAATAAIDITDDLRAKGEFFVPIRLLWSRIHTEQPTIPWQPDGHHMSGEYLQGVGAIITTLLTGRCPIGVEPLDKTTLDWRNWYCRKTGYEIAWQLGSLHSRVPGFEVLPRSATARTLSNTGPAEPLKVRFLYPPTSPVTVAVSVDMPNVVSVSPGTLTFTPDNYALPQSVSVKLNSGYTSLGEVKVNFTTSSGDSVFNGLTDQWAYFLNKPDPKANGQTVVVQKDKATPIALTGIASPGFSLRYIVNSNPTHGTLSGTAPNLIYTPTAGYTGSDQFGFYVRDSSDMWSATALVNITVSAAAAVNQAPTLDALGNLAITAGSSKSITLTGISAGLNESQVLSINATSDNVAAVLNPNLTYLSPDSTGTLRVTGVSPGIATITVTLNDGQSSNSTFQRTFAVKVDPQQFTIVPSAGSGGSISPSGSALVNSGASQTFSIVPNDGFQIADVTLDGVSVGAVSSYTLSNITADHTIAATFVVKKYHINVTAEEGGTISPTGNLVLDQGTSQTFVITANSGMQISDLTVDGISMGALTSCTLAAVTADHTIVAAFKTSGGLKGEYYNSVDLSGPVSLTRIDPVVDSNVDRGSPAPGIIRADGFSVRWTGFVQARYSEAYNISTISDDGVRVWVNGKLLIDNWTIHGPTTNQGTINLVAGIKYAIRMEYYEASGGSVARLFWSSAKQAKEIIPQSQLSYGGLNAEYFNTANLTGPVVLSRTDATVDFSWELGSPASGIVNVDNFSVRWTGFVKPRHSETYTFTTSSDDGVRLWVNDQLLIDNWTDHGITKNSGTIALQSGGLYAIRLEFYERGGGATARLEWSSASQVLQTIPQSQLSTLPGAAAPLVLASKTAAAPAATQKTILSTRESSPEGVNAMTPLSVFELMAGKFSGLIFEPENEPTACGALTANVSRKGGLSASLKYRDRVYSLHGRFDNTGSYIRSIPRRGLKPLIVALRLDSTQLSASISDGSAVSIIPIKKSSFGVSAQCAEAGRYTMGFSSEDSDDPDPVSATNGWARMRITSNGVVVISGQIEPGLRFSVRTLVSDDHSVAFYLPVRSKIADCLTGKIEFKTLAGISKPKGVMTWKSKLGDKMVSARFITGS